MNVKYLTSRNGVVLSSGDLVFIDRFYFQYEGLLEDESVYIYKTLTYPKSASSLPPAADRNFWIRRKYLVSEWTWISIYFAILKIFIFIVKLKLFFLKITLTWPIQRVSMPVISKFWRFQKNFKVEISNQAEWLFLRIWQKVNYKTHNVLNITQHNKNLTNIHQLPAVFFDLGLKIAMPSGSKGSPNKLFIGNQYSKVILCSDIHGNSEEMIRETKYEWKID